uniref:protein STPG4 isoform X2 n=1 Tax=Pristiophorus japonicus TaxID=55135 RepID=UPI00398ECDB7
MLRPHHVQNEWTGNPMQPLTSAPEFSKPSFCARNEVVNLAQKANSLVEERVSTRGGWWQENVKDKPFPGKYAIKDFIEEGLLNPVKQTYNFKGKGRSGTITSESQSGEQLAKIGRRPEALIEVGKKTSSNQVLKNTPKKKITHSVLQKGTLSAASYNLRTPVFERSSARFGKVDFSSLSSQGTFRSSVKRFPTIYFVPKEGPAPGQYNVKHQTLSPIMTSSFLSKVPRFLPSPSKTPGPGTYEPIRQLPSWTEAASDLLY